MQRDIPILKISSISTKHAHLGLGSLGNDLEPLHKGTQDTSIYRFVDILEELSLVSLAHALQWAI
jgi:hypothetical protein